MADITQTFDGHRLTFSAHSNKGYEWMRETFGKDTVSYDPKHEKDEAVQFFAFAENAGLIVSKAKS
jgi:hypothetical protein